MLARFNSIIVHGLWHYPGYATSKVIRNFGNELIEKKIDLNFLLCLMACLIPTFKRLQGRKLKAIRNVLYWKLIEGKVINNADGLLLHVKKSFNLRRQPFQALSSEERVVCGIGSGRTAALYGINAQSISGEMSKTVANSPTYYS